MNNTFTETDLIVGMKKQMSAMGAHEEDIRTAFKGATEQEQLTSFNLYLAATVGKNERVSKMRGLLVNSNPNEIMVSLKSNAGVITKAIEASHAKEPKRF